MMIAQAEDPGMAWCVDSGLPKHALGAGLVSETLETLVNPGLDSDRASPTPGESPLRSASQAKWQYPLAVLANGFDWFRGGPVRRHRGI